MTPMPAPPAAEELGISEETPEEAFFDQDQLNRP